MCQPQGQHHDSANVAPQRREQHYESNWGSTHLKEVSKDKEHSTRTLKLGEWEVRLTSYKLGDSYHCTADNVEPGAWIARAQGATREEAENRASQRARKLLGRTRRKPNGLR